MDRVKDTAGFFYRHSFVRYVFVGGSTFAIDLGLLVVLHDYMGIIIPVAASISYWTAIAYNFTLNRLWTFSATDKANLSKHLALYLLLLGFNYLFTVTFVSIASHFINYAIAKVIAVTVQISWTYYLYKTKIFVS